MKPLQKVLPQISAGGPGVVSLAAQGAAKVLHGEFSGGCGNVMSTLQIKARKLDPGVKVRRSIVLVLHLKGFVVPHLNKLLFPRPIKSWDRRQSEDYETAGPNSGEWGESFEIGEPR